MIGKDEVGVIEKKAKKLRNLVIDMIGIGSVGHIGGSCSSADIVASLYFNKMNIFPNDIKNKDRDIFILSKGHVSFIQYAALAECGFFDAKELLNAKNLNSMLQGHPDVNKTPGVEANTGSLGQGLSIGNGFALAKRLDNSKGKVYVIIGDGELAEGQIWEAAMAATNFKIDNIVAILDKNCLQATGTVLERFNTNPIIPKWQAFGWHTIEIDGHNIPEILSAFDEADTIKGKPTIIVANTIKGKGISFAENVVSFHNGMMNKEQFDIAKKELR